MKQNVNFSTFQTAFENLRPNNFSYEGLTALYDYLTQFEEDTGEELEMDVIALCCDYSELTEMEIRSSYGLEDSDSSTAYLENNTFIVGTTKTTVIFQNF